MAALKLADVRDKKKASGGPYKGLNYQDIVRSKIKDKKPFTIGDKDNANKVYGMSFQQNSNQFILSYAASKTSKKISGSKPITQFFKDDTDKITNHQNKYKQWEPNGGIVDFLTLGKIDA